MTARVLPEGVEHGTPEGYDAGCRTTHCPTGIELGFSCARAKSAERDDPRYKKLRRAGLSVDEIAEAMNTSLRRVPTDRIVSDKTVTTALEMHRADELKKATAASKATKRKTRKTTTPKPAPAPEPAPTAPAATEEDTMPTIAELAPELTDKLTQTAVTTAADTETQKTRTKATKGSRASRAAEAEDRTTTSATPDDAVNAETTTPPVEATAWYAAAEPTPAEQEDTEARIIARTENKHATGKPVDSTTTAADIDAAWAGAAAALHHMGLALHSFAEAINTVTANTEADRAAIIARIEKVEHDTKTARAVAAALASIRVEDAA